MDGSRHQFVKRATRTGTQEPLPEVLIAAAELLGWVGTVHWPVIACGVRMAVVSDSEANWHAGPSGAWAVGCIVPGLQGAVARASLWAGYMPRAALIPEESDALSIQVDAAILDVGVVSGWRRPRLLLKAGPTVRSPMFESAVPDRRWARLVDSVLTASAL